MKLFFVLAVVTGTLALLAEGAPQILSEELGNAVEQLKEMIQSEIQAVEAKSAYGPRARLSNHPREQSYTRSGAQKLASKQQSERVTAQVRGVDIKQNCGPAAAAINTALAPLSNYFPNAFGVLVDCQVSPGCVQVRVDVPADDVLTDIDVCDLGNGQACVQVYVEPTTTCVGIIPIPIPIPLANGQLINIQIFIDPPIPFFSPQGCVTVRVNAPQC